MPSFKGPLILGFSLFSLAFSLAISMAAAAPLQAQSLGEAVQESLSQSLFGQQEDGSQGLNRAQSSNGSQEARYQDGVAAAQAGDFATAYARWEPLAAKGHPRAQYDLGGLYEYGRGVDASDRMALDWYERAARQDLAPAQYRMGVLLENGWGADSDSAAAAHWYRKAARQGHPLAQHDLAFLYAAGEGVPQDPLRAYMWLHISVLQGNALMVEHRDHLAKSLTPGEISAAEGLAVHWVRQQQR